MGFTQEVAQLSVILTRYSRIYGRIQSENIYFFIFTQSDDDNDRQMKGTETETRKRERTPLMTSGRAVAIIDRPKSYKRLRNQGRMIKLYAW